MAITKKRVVKKKKSTKVIVNVRNQANANSGGSGGGGSIPIYIPQSDSSSLTNLTNHITSSMANLLGMKQHVKEPVQPVNQYFYNHNPIPPTAPNASTIVEPDIKFENFQEMTPRRPSLMDNVGDMPKFDINTALLPTPAPFSDPNENQPQLEVKRESPRIPPLKLTSDKGTSPQTPRLDTRAQYISYIKAIDEAVSGIEKFGMDELRSVYRSFNDEGRQGMFQKIDIIKEARKNR